MCILPSPFLPWKRLYFSLGRICWGGPWNINVFSLISPPWKRLYFYDSGEVVGEIKVYPQLPYHWKACSFTGGPQTQQLKLCYPTFYSQRHTSWIKYPVVHQDEIRMPSWGDELHWCWFSFSVQVWMTHEYPYPYALTLGSHCSRHKWSWYFCTLAIPIPDKYVQERGHAFVEHCHNL